MQLSDKMKKVHELELMIALEVKRICEKNDINYFLTAGTLLGAVRHKGFIPWDDDMDIGMLRKDYEKFLKVCEEDLQEQFFLQTWDTDQNYPYSFAKIRLKNTCFVEDFSEVKGEHNGFFIDIFPFDNVPDNIKDREKQKKKVYIYKRLLWIKKGYGKTMKKQSIIQCLKYYMFKIFSLFFVYENVKEKYRRIQKKYNNIDTKKIVTDGSYSYDKESIPRKWTEKFSKISFEGVEFLTYENPKEYLEYFYGDYMKLPPKEKRIGHMPKNIDFGNY